MFPKLKISSLYIEQMIEKWVLYKISKIIERNKNNKFYILESKISFTKFGSKSCLNHNDRVVHDSAKTESTLSLPAVICNK